MWWVIIPIALIMLSIYLYNNLHARKNQIEFAKSSIDALLKKRYDLIPNLNRMVSGYAQHEKSLFENLAKARSEAMRYPNISPARFKSESSIASGLGQVLMLAENYPELKADQQFMQFQKTLLELEEQISAARRFYNAAINDYNNAVQTFPWQYHGNFLGFKRRGYFTIPPIETQVPAVHVMNRDIYQIYRDELRPYLQALEQERLILLQKAKWSLGIASGLTLLMLGMAIFNQFSDSSLAGIGFVALPSFAAAFFFIWSEYQGYKRAFKQFAIPHIIKCFGKDIQYTPTGSIGLNEFVDSYLFNQEADRFEGQNLVIGTLGQTRFKVSEVHAQIKQESKNNDAYTTIFKGIYFTANFYKHFRGSTFVLPDSFGAKPGSMFQPLQRLVGHYHSRGELLSLEDPEFERYFATYSNNQITARYLLSTSLMARLVDFRKKHGKTLYLSLIDGYIYLALETNQTLFNPPLFKTLLDIKLYETYMQDMNLMLGIIEDLELNQDIWMRQDLVGGL